MIWEGGSCPGCGEDVPRGMLRCRFCGQSLTAKPQDDTSGQPPATSGIHPPSRLPPDEAGLAVPAIPEKPQVRRVRPRPVAPVPPAVRTAASVHPTEQAESATSAGQPANESAPVIIPLDWLPTGWTKLLVCALLCAPLLVSGPVPDAPTNRSWLVKPMIHSGDEPHQLVLLHSLLDDGDFDVANNYAAVHAGGWQAGRKYAGWALDHHVLWYARGRAVRWWEAYETEQSNWRRNEAGQPVPTFRKDSSVRPLGRKEYSRHAPGLALLLAPALWLVRGTTYVEPLALLLTALITCLGFWLCCELAETCSGDPTAGVLTGSLVYLGTPLWHYSRVLMPEPWGATALLLAYVALLIWERPYLGGIALAALWLLKPLYLVLAIPLLIALIWQRNWSTLPQISIPVGLSVALTALWNHQQRGDWQRFPQIWETGDPVSGLAGLLFSPAHGLILSAPVMLLALPGYWLWTQRQPVWAVSTLTAGGLAWIIFGSGVEWWGGACFAARYLIPVLPLVGLSLAALLRREQWVQLPLPGQLVILMIAAGSIVLNAYAAFSCENVWGKHPLELWWS